MKYRVTILTPTLIGDGMALSPIDYMVWKDHVNVLDQTKIFSMMAKRPVFEGYLAQLRKAEKFDFQNWGGLAQSAAERRIPFQSSTCTAVWDRARAEHLFIPTFLRGTQGHYLPGSALRGAFRTAMVHKSWKARGEKLLADWKTQFQNERGYRYAAQPQEAAAIGTRGEDRMRAIAAGDSKAVKPESFRVYLTRVAKLTQQGSKLEIGWKAAPRGSVDSKRIADSIPTFVEMATPGTVFEGAWQNQAFLARPEVLKALRWKEAPTDTTLAQAANEWAAEEIEIQKRYAEAAGLPVMRQILEELGKRLDTVQSAKRGCLLQIGWGGGFAAKAALGDTTVPAYREILKKMPFYAQALATGLPFPKTRRVVFHESTPAQMPGWVHVEWN